MMIHPQHVTGLILAGGRGSRMGGVDKGLQPHAGMSLVMHALNRLSPQVGQVVINANRNLDHYASFAVPVWPDTVPDYPGPLAGFLVGLTRCTTPWLVTVPCDAPLFPQDLVARLAHAVVQQQADMAMSITLEGSTPQTQPVFCLMKACLAGHLAAYLRAGPKKVATWAEQHRCVQVRFHESHAFANANTLDDLRQLLRP